MHFSHRRLAIFSLVAGLLSSATLAAQVSTTVAPQPPMIEVTGIGQAKVTPDRALVMLGVQTKGRTAAIAGQENARLAAAILAAVRAAGIAREQVSTLNYSVNPSYRYYPDGRKPELTGYDATNTVRVEVRSLELVGKVIDASLGAGANTISGLSFYASQLDSTRRAALASATQDARLSAETMATAAGGSLGPLMSVTSQTNEGPQPYQMQTMAMRGKAADEATPVVPPTEQTVNASVVGRWQFVPGPAR